MTRHRDDAPPTGLWLAVLLLVVLLLGPLYGAFRLEWLADIGGRGNADHEWPRYRSDGGAVVMGVGSSLLQAGVVHANLAVDDRSQWLLFNRVGGNFQNFGGLLHSRWPVQPQVLVVQSDMFLKDPAPDVRAFLALLRVMAGPAARWALGLPPPKADDAMPFLAVPPGEEQKRGETLAMLYQRPPSEQGGLIDWLRLQQSRGSRVVLLDIPRSPSIEKAIGAPLVRWRADMQVIAAQLQVPLLRYDGRLTDADFYDGSHMRPSGRQPHTRWLQQKVGDLQHESR